MSRRSEPTQQQTTFTGVNNELPQLRSRESLKRQISDVPEGPSSKRTRVHSLRDYFNQSIFKQVVKGKVFTKKVPGAFVCLNPDCVLQQFGRNAFARDRLSALAIGLSGVNQLLFQATFPQLSSYNRILSILSGRGSCSRLKLMSLSTSTALLDMGSSAVVITFLGAHITQQTSIMMQIRRKLGCSKEDPRINRKNSRYNSGETPKLLSQIINPNIIKLTENDHKKGMADLGPFDSHEHD
ncbi:hypothetical protein V8B55DRAFT_1570552 [Mucor lusitanicus]